MSFKLKPPIGTPLNPCHSLSRGLVGAWLMNERGGAFVYDLSRNRHIPTFTTAPKWCPEGLYFDGNTTKSILTFPDMTAAFSTEASIMVKLRMQSHAPLAINSGIGTFGTSGIDNLYPYTNGSIYLDWFRNDRPSLGNIGIPDRTQWHTITITNKPGANNWKFYQNAIQYYSTTGEDVVYMPAAPRLGGTGDVLYNLHGWVEFVYIYNRVLTEHEIASLHANPYQMFEPVIPIWMLGYEVAAGASYILAATININFNCNIHINAGRTQ